MDDKTVHDLLDGALAGEPPIGPVAQNALTAGLRLRRRRRRIRAAAATAVAAVIAVAIPAGLGAFGHLLGPARPQQSPAPPTLYIYSDNGSHGGTVTPVNTATGTHGKPIHVGLSGSTPKGGFAPADGQIAITPDGKTAYLITGSSVTPVSTATGTPGKPIYIDGNPFHYPDFIAITPDGKTAYVTQQASGTITPISTATGTPGKPIHISGLLSSVSAQIVITPDGKTVYVTTMSGTVVPISTATNMPGKPIRVGMTGGAPKFSFGPNGGQIVITPDGKTAYVATTSGTVVPISTATNTPGKQIHFGGGLFTFLGEPCLVITPDGKTVYVTTGSGVTPINTATNTPGKPIHAVAGYTEVTVIRP